jgi:hypothetical protein
MYLKKIPQIIFFLVNFFIFTYLLYTRNNTTTSDLSGHFASAKYFFQGYFHSYNDNQFLGSVQNLFYPPMQDIIISLISFFTKGDFAHAGYIYLYILSYTYLFSICYLSGIIKNTYARSVFLFCITLWLYVAKFQIGLLGLSFDDLINIGLSTQFLGTIFLLILLRRIIENDNYIIISLLCFLCLFSHIIVGMLAVCLLIGYSLRNLDYIKSLFLSLGMSSLVWIPFSFYSKYIIKHPIYVKDDIRLISICSFSFIIFIFYYIQRKNLNKNLFNFNKYSILLIGAFFILLINIIGSFNLIKIIDFHYYRLIVYAYLFFLIEFCLYMENKNKLILSLLTIIIILIFKFTNVTFIDKQYYSDFDLKYKINSDKNINYMRTYYVANINPANVYFSQYMQSLIPNNFKAAQGLYWESSKSNHSLASYEQTLFLKSSSAIDSVWHTPTTCAVQACYLDQFFRDYNIGNFVIDPNLNNTSLPAFQKMCLVDTIKKQITHKNMFTLNGNIKLIYSKLHKEINLNYYSVSNIYATAYSNNLALEIIPSYAKIFYYDTKKRHYFFSFFNELNNYCLNNNKSPFQEFHSLFFPKELQNINFNFDNHQNNIKLSQINFIKESINHFKLNINSDHDVWFKIKLSWIPGLNLYSSNGNKINTYTGLHYIVAYGHGNMNLTYERTPIFYVGYLISLFSFIFFIILIFKKKRSLSGGSFFLRAK